MNIASLTSRCFITPWLKAKNFVSETVKMLIPTHIREVVHINEEASILHKDGYWMHNTQAIAKLNESEMMSGYYYIRTWDGLNRKPRQYFLSANNLKNALGLKSLSTWWTLHDYGIQVLLNGWYAFHYRSTPAIFSIYDSDGVDQTHAVQPFMDSLEIKGNVTGHGLTTLLKYLGHIDPNTERQITKVVHYNLVEREIKGGDFITEP